MTTKSVVVSGEASETDSEDDNHSAKPTPVRMPTSIQGEVITGEDSESEYEFNQSVSSATSALTNNLNSPMQESKIDISDSLLHKKLKESNREIHKGMEHFAQKTVSEASEVLSTIEQQLLKSQITLQNALTSLKSLNNNSVAIRNKLKSVISSKFLPTVNTE